MNKPTPTHLTKDWTLEELACSCGCGGEHQPSVLAALQQLARALQVLRDRLGRPMSVTCAYRCLKHNSAVGGAPGSEHIRGIAADVVTIDQQTLAVWASQIPEIGGIGLYPGRGFIHLDLRPRRANAAITWWEQVDGKYQPLRGATKVALLKAGARGL